VVIFDQTTCIDSGLKVDRVKKSLLQHDFVRTSGLLRVVEDVDLAGCLVLLDPQSQVSRQSVAIVGVINVVFVDGLGFVRSSAGPDDFTGIYGR